MNHLREAAEFLRENDVRFVQLNFCDLFGGQRTVSVLAREIPRAFSEGVAFDASAVPGFLTVEQSDLFLHPDASTLALLPWRPGKGRSARMFCDVRHPGGESFAGDGRRLLQNACDRAAAMGLSCQVGSECEFYLFELDDRGNPTRLPADRAGYLEPAPFDRGEAVRRDICLTLEEMGIVPESLRHEQGPGQNEIVFRHSDAALAADELMTFRGAVRAAAAENGLFCSFLPKPLEQGAGSGLHINLSLTRGDENLFAQAPPTGPGYPASFLAGILRHAGEMAAALNPLTNSYRRLGSQSAPRHIAWGRSNRSALVRIPAVTDVGHRMELRSPDPACNPYLALTLLLHAGLDGIEHSLSPGPECRENLFLPDAAARLGLQTLPGSLGEALDCMEQSKFVRRVLPDAVLAQYVAQKRREQALFDAAEDKFGFEQAFYFERY